MRFRLFYLWLTKKKKITLTSILLKILLIGKLRISYVTGSKYFWILVLISVFNWDLKVIEDTKISCVPGNCPGSSWKHLLSCHPLADHSRTTALFSVLLRGVPGKSGLCGLPCDKLRRWYEGYIQEAPSVTRIQWCAHMWCPHLEECLISGKFISEEFSGD